MPHKTSPYLQKDFQQWGFLMFFLTAILFLVRQMINTYYFHNTMSKNDLHYLHYPKFVPQ